MIGEIQRSLFKPKPSSEGRLFAKTELISFDPNLADAFGVTKTGLDKGSYGVLENIFYGMPNIKIPLEMLSIENPVEILSIYLATSILKKGNLHRSSNSDIPRDFLKLVAYLNRCSYTSKGFRSLAKEFKDKECFDIEQEIRLKLLEQDVEERFVNSFFATYKPSNKENLGGFYDPNCDGRSKGIYTNLIYDKLVSLGKEAKKL
jgi:hypothetical protein